MTKRKQQLLLIILILIIVVIGGALFGKFHDQAETTKGSSFTPEMLYQVTKGSLEKTVATEGYIQAVKEQTLTFPVKSDGSLKLAKVNVEKGDLVKKGTLLMVLDKAEAKLRYTQKLNNYNRVKITGSPKEIEEAKIDMELAREQLANMELMAPFDGVITEVNVEEGDNYASGEVATIKDITLLEVEVSIEEKNIPQVKLEQNARVTLESVPGKTFGGKITEIATEVENNNGIVTLPVTITLDQTAEEIKLGCSAQVDIIVGEVHEQIIIPLTAVFTKDNQDMVVKVVNGKLQPVPVETGLSDGLRIAIESGLEEGARILLNTFRQAGESSGQLSQQTGRSSDQTQQGGPGVIMRMGPGPERGGR